MEFLQKYILIAPFVHEHVQREIDYLTKEKYRITKENEQITKEREEEHHRNNVIALYMLRKAAPEDFSAEEYADLLSIDCSVIKQVYEKLHSDPAPDEGELFALLNQRK